MDNLILMIEKSAASFKVLKRMQDIVERNPAKYKSLIRGESILANTNYLDTALQNEIPSNNIKRVLAESFPSVAEPDIYKGIRNHKIQLKDSVDAGATVSVYDLGQVRPKNMVSPATPHIGENYFAKPDRVTELYKEKRENGLTNVHSRYAIDTHPNYETVVNSDYLKDRKAGEFFNLMNLNEPKPKYSVQQQQQSNHGIGEYKNQTNNKHNSSVFNFSHGNTKGVDAGRAEQYFNEMTRKHRAVTNKKIDNLKADLTELPMFKNPNHEEVHNSGVIPEGQPLRDRYVFKGSNRQEEVLANKSLWTTQIPQVALHYTRENINLSKPVYYRTKNPETFKKIMDPFLAKPLD